MKRIVFISLAICLLFAACKNTPTTPTPTVQAIVVNSTSDMFYIGISETFTATMTMSDGTSKTVTAGVWGGDTPSVATVAAATGRVTIVGSGNVTIFVDYQGRRGTKLIRGLPNYQGVWSGSYYTVSCTCSDDWCSVLHFCNIYPVNEVWPCNFNLTQDRDRVQGRFSLGQISTDTSGSIQNDGQLLLTGATHEGIFTTETSWRMQSATPGRITGDVSMIWRATGLWGDARTSASIRDLNRTSTMATGLPPSGQRLLNPTLEDVIRALIRR